MSKNKKSIVKKVADVGGSAASRAIGTVAGLALVGPLVLLVEV